MSRKPETPRTDDDPAGFSESADLPAGRRYSRNREILAIEAASVAEGNKLPNRTIPIEFHPEKRDYSDDEEIRTLIEAEAAKKHPNKQLIALLNEQLE